MLKTSRLRCAQHLADECLCPEIIQYRLAMAKEELEDKDIGELWRRYRPLEGRDDQADLVVALVRKLVVQGARKFLTAIGRNDYRTRSRLTGSHWRSGMMGATAYRFFVKFSIVLCDEKGTAGQSYKVVADQEPAALKPLNPA